MSSVLDYWNAYKAMVSFLEDYYFQTKLDDLGALMGTMDYRIFSGGEPMDNSIVLMWLDTLKEEDIMREDVDIDEGLIFVKKFVIKMAEYFNYDLKILIDDLEAATDQNNSKGIEIRKKWIDCFLNAQSTY